MCVLQARDSQKSSHRLQDDLVASQQECERLQGELQQVLLQLDTHVRWDTHTHAKIYYIEHYYQIINK